MQVRDIYLLFLDKLEIKDIIKNKEKYEKIFKDANSKENEMQNLINSVKNKSDELLLKLEQNVSQQEFADIKEYYKKMIEKTEKERNINGILFYSLSILLSALLVFIFFKMPCIYPNNYLLIPKSILSFTLIGSISFMINDFRKRFNISKNILDELLQKQIVVDTYSSLISRIKDFEPETKKKYHEKIIQNIIDTLLLIRNHGYLSKVLNQDNNNFPSKIIEEIGNIVQKK